MQVDNKKLIKSNYTNIGLNADFFSWACSLSSGVFVFDCEELTPYKRKYSLEINKQMVFSGSFKECIKFYMNM